MYYLSRVHSWKIISDTQDKGLQLRFRTQHSWQQWGHLLAPRKGWRGSLIRSSALSMALKTGLPFQLGYTTTLQPGIDCARLPREDLFAALPRKVDTILTRELGACRAKSERFFVPRQGNFSVLCPFSWHGLMAFRCFFRGKMENANCLALIQLCKSKYVLWNSKNANYHNKCIREDAWKDVDDEMKMPVQYLKKKMTTLLASYRRESLT
jgi:hypothetical protein